MEGGKTYQEIVDTKAFMEDILKNPWVNFIPSLLKVHSEYWCQNAGMNKTPFEEELKEIGTWVISDITIILSWIIAGVGEDQYSQLVRRGFLALVLFAASISMVCTSFTLACYRSAKRLTHAASDYRETGNSSSEESCTSSSSSEESCTSSSDEEPNEEQENASAFATEPSWKILHQTEFAWENMTLNLQENKSLTYADVEHICDSLELLCRKREKLIMETLFGERTSVENPDFSFPENLFSINDAAEMEHTRDNKGLSDSETGSPQLSPDECLYNCIRNAHEIFNYDFVQDTAYRQKHLPHYLYSNMPQSSEYFELRAQSFQHQVGQQSSSLQMDRAGAPASVENVASAGTSDLAGVEVPSYAIVGSRERDACEKTPSPGSRVQTESKRSISTYEEQETKSCNEDKWGKSGSYRIAVVDSNIDGMAHISGVPANNQPENINDMNDLPGIELLVLMSKRAVELWERISDLRFSTPLPMPDSSREDVKSVFGLLYPSLDVLKDAALRKKSMGLDLRLWHLRQGLLHYTTPSHLPRSSPGQRSSRLSAAEDPENSGESGTASPGGSISTKSFSRSPAGKRQHAPTDEITDDMKIRLKHLS